jgi:hypothetical protein
MYKLLLFFKYIKYCILKNKLIVNTYSYYDSNYIDSIKKYNTKLYQLKNSNGRNVVALFKNYINCGAYSNRIYKGYKYDFKYQWIFLGYEDQKLLQHCTWKEFKNIYTTFFYPHLISEEECTANLVIDKLSSKLEDDIKPEFFIR